MPPTPHGLSGYILYPSGTQVPLGTRFFVNNTNITSFISSQTSVPAPGYSGYYSVSINGTDNNTINLRAWNRTVYGNIIVRLAGDMKNVNVTLNITRPSEPNISFTAPGSNSLFNSTDFNITANFTVIGGSSGVSCGVSISFTNQSIIVVDSYQKNLGARALGSVTVVNWVARGNNTGSTNISINASCGSDGLIFDNENWDLIYNISINDSEPPVVSLVSPLNNTLRIYSSNITFYFNVSDISTIQSCSLIINEKENQTISNPEKNRQLNFTQYLANSQYNWSVNCTDQRNMIGSSSKFNLTVYFSPPNITNIIIEPAINLEAGTTKNVDCNFTVSDGSGLSSISMVNATLYEANNADPSSPLDRNFHYINDTCTVNSFSGISVNYTCSFDVSYYANNGSWICNASIIDNINLSFSRAVDTHVNTLLAVFVPQDTLDYGSVDKGTISNERNVTIYNYGNMNVSVSVYGYAINETNTNAVSCSQGGSVPLYYEKYSIYENSNFNDMANLTNESQIINQFSLLQRTQDTMFGSDRNQTFWKMFIPTSTQKGPCSGFIVFKAS